MKRYLKNIDYKLLFAKTVNGYARYAYNSEGASIFVPIILAIVVGIYYGIWYESIVKAFLSAFVSFVLVSFAGFMLYWSVIGIKEGYNNLIAWARSYERSIKNK